MIWKDEAMSWMESCQKQSENIQYRKGSTRWQENRFFEQEGKRIRQVTFLFLLSSLMMSTVTFELPFELWKPDFLSHWIWCLTFEYKLFYDDLAFVSSIFLSWNIFHLIEWCFLSMYLTSQKYGTCFYNWN